MSAILNVYHMHDDHVTQYTQSSVIRILYFLSTRMEVNPLSHEPKTRPWTFVVCHFMPQCSNNQAIIV